MEYIHAAGWAHRDLKPANVLLDGSDLRLADFGLALPIGDDATRLTATHEFVGSRAYLPPENEDGVNDEVDQRPADFYAFGKLTWALLAGRPALSREKQLVEPERLEDQLGTLFTGIDGLCAQLLRSDLRVRLDNWSVVVTELRDAIRRITGHDGPATCQPNLKLEEIAARFASSRRAAEIEAQRDLRVQRQQYAAKLRANITRTVTTESDRYTQLKRSSKDLVQVSVGYGGMPGRDAVRILKVDEPPGLDWDEDSLQESAAALISANGMFRPTPNAVGIGCWVLVSDDDAYFLIGAYVNGPRTGIVTPAPLAQRYGSIAGPFRLGLSAADDAAVSAGRKVIEQADELAVSYITALQGGVEIDGEGRWLQST